MKRWILALLCVLQMDAATVTGLVVSGDNQGYVTLSDGSAWRVFSVVRRWRGPFEWWRDDDLNIPHNFVASLREWYMGAEVEVVERQIFPLDPTNASNQSDIMAATHVLFNEREGRLMLGHHIPLGQCLLEVYDKGKQQGISEGYRKGYDEGYKKGYDKGFSACEQEQEEDEKAYVEAAQRRSDPPPPYPGY